VATSREGRLHARPRDAGLRDDALAHEEPSVRSAQGLRAGGDDRLHADGAGGASERAGEDRKEFIALAKSKPGSLNFASLGAATTQGLPASMFNFMTGIDAVQVPYKGSAPGTTDLLAGNVQFMFNALPSMLPHIHAGKIRALGTTGSKRASQLPDIPTIKDAVPGYEVVTWYSFVAPAGTPKAVIEKLNREISAIVESPQMKEKLKEQGLEADAMKPEELAKLYRDETAKWAKVIKDSKISPE
jgi:tripartite-type tricarboxylate transporter receptor subunit TctC